MATFNIHYSDYKDCVKSKDKAAGKSSISITPGYNLIEHLLQSKGYEIGFASFTK